MGWRIKNFNIFGVYGKIWALEGGVGWGGGYEKPIYRGDCLEKGAWTVCRFKEGLGKKRGGGVFERGDQ